MSMTKAAFVAAAKSLTVKLGTREFKAKPKLFSTRSCGWNVSEKAKFTVSGNAATPQDFLKLAGKLAVAIGGVFADTVPVKEFSSGNVGWNANGKVTVEVGGHEIDCQLGLNVTVIAKHGWKAGDEFECQVGMNLTAHHSKEWADA